jgi:hypothetical protein
VERSQRCDNESLRNKEKNKGGKILKGVWFWASRFLCIPFMGGRVSTTIPPKSYHAEKEDGPVAKDLDRKRVARGK